MVKNIKNKYENILSRIEFLANFVNENTEKVKAAKEALDIARMELDMYNAEHPQRNVYGYDLVPEMSRNSCHGCMFKQKGRKICPYEIKPCTLTSDAARGEICILVVIAQSR